jgi:hypothetical protein
MANGASVDFRHAYMTFGARSRGKSWAHLVGTPLMPFHEWKSAYRAAEAPLVRPTSDYHTLYGRYCANHRAANSKTTP